MKAAGAVAVFGLLLAALAACGQQTLPPRAKEVGGDPARGKVALQQHACTGCHAIPGVVGANSPVGPPLDRMAKRKYIAGIMPNTPENMIRWLRDPQSVAPLSAMPDLDVSDGNARDMAAYLYTLD